MSVMKFPILKIKIAFAISLALLCWTRVQAQPINRQLLEQRPTQPPNRQLSEQPLSFAAPRPPRGIGAPGRRSEAGSRGCKGRQLPEFEGKQLTALVPVYPDYQPPRLILGATTSEHPTFWFFVPYQSPFSGQFVLQDQDGNRVYKTDVTLPEKPGVISLSHPDQKPLEIGKPYRWYFKIYCKSKIPPSYVDGWIQRSSLDPALKSQLEKASPREKVALYATNGLWYEALTAASELRRTDPNNSDWAGLLRNVGLNDIAPEPIVK